MSPIRYDRPLSAGHIACVTPGSLALEYAISFDRIVELRDATRRLDGIRKQVPQDVFRAEMKAAPDVIVEFIGSMAHERDHVRRLLSTTYGFLCDAARCQLVRATASAAGAVGGRAFGGRIARSRAAYLRTRRLGGEAARIVDAEAGPFLAIHRLQLFLDAITDGAPDPWLQSEFARIGLHPDLADPTGDDARLSSPQGGDTPASPRLTTRHVLEMFAVLEHGNGLSRKACAIDDVRRLLDTMSGEYRTVLDAWNALYRNARIGPITSQPRAADDLVFDWYRLYPVELYVAADLALWPPFLPGQERVIEDGRSWHDLSPASRFIKTLSYFERSGLRPTPIPAAQRNEQFLELQDAACRQFDWPTPAALADSWATALAASLASGVSYWSEIDGPSMYRTANAARLLAIRQARPCDAVLNNIDYVRHGIDRPPVWVFTEPDGTKRPLPFRRDEPSLLLPFVMTELTQYMVNGYRVSMSHLYDRKFREVAASEYSSRLATVGGWGKTAEDELYEHLHDHVVVRPDRHAEALWAKTS